MTEAQRADSLYGVLARFDQPRDLIAAARAVRRAGYRRVDGYSPFPVHGLTRAIGFRKTGLPLLVLIGGVCGLVGGFALQYWTTVIDYPLNVGGRPLNSWPAFMPVTFETTILASALTTVLGMLALNGLPRPNHPLFAVEEFARATRDGFFLCIESRDRQFEPREARRILQQAGAVEVVDVPAIR